MLEQKAIHIVVHGRVQGVGFRYFTRESAVAAGVAGWVRNVMDGTVEIWAEGTEAQLTNLIHAVEQGPSHSWVEHIDCEWQTPKGESRSFYVRY